MKRQNVELFCEKKIWKKLVWGQSKCFSSVNLKCFFAVSTLFIYFIIKYLLKWKVVLRWKIETSFLKCQKGHFSIFKTFFQFFKKYFCQNWYNFVKNVNFYYMTFSGGKLFWWKFSDQLYCQAPLHCWSSVKGIV